MVNQLEVNQLNSPDLTIFIPFSNLHHPHLGRQFVLNLSFNLPRVASLAITSICLTQEFFSAFSLVQLMRMLQIDSELKVDYIT